MTLRNTENTYGSLAKVLHWGMAVLVIALICIGLFMTRQPDGDPKWALYDLHKAIGSVVFLVLLVRMAWRHLSPPPAMPVSLTPFEQKAAHGAHVLLYAFMLALPVTGYLDSSFGGYHISFFGFFDVPMLFAKNETLFEICAAAHSYIGWALTLVVLAHIGAALKHHFIAKDDVLKRMTFGG